MDVVQEYEDILQNIEQAIVSVYREHPEITDYAVMRVLEASINHYVAEKLGKPPKVVSLDKIETEMLEKLQERCDWRMGSPGPQEAPSIVPVSVDVIIACLKRILKSVQMWNKRGGRQGYLLFVSQYVQ